MKMIFTVLLACSYLFCICCSLHARTISDRIDFTPGFDNGRGPVSVAINPETNRVYAGNSIARNVSVIDSNGNQVIDSIPVFGIDSGLECTPEHFAFNNLTNRLYLIGGSCFAVDVGTQDYFVIVDSLTNRILDDFFVKGFGRLTDIGVHSGINKVYLSSLNDIVVIDGSTNEHIETIVNAVEIQSGAKISLGAPGTVNALLGSLIIEGNNLYFAFNKTVAVIDVLTNDVTKTIRQEGDIFDMEVDLPRNRIYAAVEDSVVVIDTMSNEIIITIPLEELIRDIAINTEDGLIHAFSGGKIFTINSSTNSVVNTIEIEGDAIDVDSGNNRIYVVNSDVDDVMVIDEPDGNLLSLIELDARPSGVGINLNTNRIYTSFMDRSMLFVTDGTTKEVIDKITVGDAPLDVAVDSVTNQIYVANSGSNDISVIDGAIGKVVETVALGELPMRIGINSDTNRIYITTDKSIIVMDGNTNDLVDAVDAQASSITINPITNLIYAMTSDGIMVIDGSSNLIIDSMDISGDEVIINPESNHLYVALENSNTIIVLDATTKVSIAEVKLGVRFNTPMEFGVNPGRNHIYLLHRSESSPGFPDGSGEEERFVSVIDGSNNKVISLLRLDPSPNRSFGLGRVCVDPTNDLAYASGEGDIFVIFDPELKSLSVTTSRGKGILPIRIRKRDRTAEVLALDGNNQPIPNLIVNASANGDRVRLDTDRAVTNEEGKALFDYRFMLSGQHQEIVFSADGIETSISDRRKETK